MTNSELGPTELVSNYIEMTKKNDAIACQYHAQKLARTQRSLFSTHNFRHRVWRHLVRSLATPCL